MALFPRLLEDPRKRRVQHIRAATAVQEEDVTESTKKALPNGA
jgi:hypothetical protein